MVATAKLLKNGSSQAVRLPRAFRFEGEEVCVKQIGSAVLLFPREAAWDLMGEALGKVDGDFGVECDPSSASKEKMHRHPRKDKR